MLQSYEMHQTLARQTTSSRAIRRICGDTRECKMGTPGDPDIAGIGVSSELASKRLRPENEAILVANKEFRLSSPSSSPRSLL